MHLWGVDWSSGWAGNITAEIVGLVGGLLVAYFVADGVVRWRLGQQQRPVRERLRQKLHRTILMVNSRWAAALDIPGAYGMERSSAELETEVRSKLRERLGFIQNQTLEERTARRLEGAQTFPSGILNRLGTGIVEDLQEMSGTADRYANVLEDEPTVHALVGDLEDYAPRIRRSLAALEGWEAAGLEGTGKSDIITMCLLAFDTCSKLRNRLDSSS